MESPSQRVRPPSANDRRVVECVVVVVGVVLVIALLKPWGLPTRSPGDIDRAAGPAAGASPPSVPIASVSVVDEQVLRFCFAPSGWRLYAVEQWIDRQVRSWKAIEPIAFATGPDDPAIPITPIAAQRVDRVGFCAPVDAGARPPSASRSSLFASFGRGGASEGRRLPIDPPRLEPAAGASVLGAVYGPPAVPSGGGDAVRRGWPAGTYVIRVRAPRGTFERWFGFSIEPIDLRPRP